jgi:hypothetical protein
MLLITIKSQEFVLKFSSACMSINRDVVKKGKAIPVTGRGGLQGCEMLRIPHCLGNRLTDGGKYVSLTHPPHFTPQKHYYFCFRYTFLLEAE